MVCGFAVSLAATAAVVRGALIGALRSE